MDSYFLTIITPTYNRYNSLKILYENLKSQTCKDFIWYVVDDGSTDKTQKMFETISDVNVRYFYKANGGKHTAINYVRKYINTSVVFIVDSDDYLAINAVQVIKDNWIKYQDKSIISHWYLQQDIRSRQIVGNRFKTNVLRKNYKNVILKSKMGDKKAVYRSTIFKNYEFPVFQGEFFLVESTFHIQASNLGDSYFFNNPIYFSEYQIGGLTKQGKKLQIKNPHGGLENAVLFINSNIDIKLKIKKIILFNIYSKLTGIEFRLNLKKIPLFASILAVCLYPVSYVIKIKWERNYSDVR